MRTNRQRLFVAPVITLLALVCGAVIGHALAQALLLKEAKVRLDQFSTHVMAESDTSAAEARRVIASIAASPFAHCTHEDVAYMRTLVFHSIFLKEGGRFLDARIACSAMLGHDKLPDTKFAPIFVRPDGSKLYRDMTPFQIAGKTVIAVQVGDAFVVYSPFTLGRLEAVGMHYTLSDVGPSMHGRVEGSEAPDGGSVLTTEGQAQLGNTLYATHCSTHYFSCVAAYTSVSDALNAHRRELDGLVLAGALCGAVIGALSSLFFIRRGGIEQQLRRAIRRDELHLAYQPIVELSSGQIVGAEALARWTDSEQLVVGPEVFIHIAEERGFVGAITRLVVRRALREFGPLLRSNPEFRISVNIAAADLTDPAFLPMMEESLAAVSVRPQSIVIEITESSTARHPTAIKTILQLRQAGHSVHIDDFGTGYSSLAYLHELSVDAIKIDRTFTRTIGTDAVTVAILPQILAMAEALNLGVVVEGVETAEQAQYFAGSTYPILGQGWYFGYPMSAEMLRGLLEANVTASLA